MNNRVLGTIAMICAAAIVLDIAVVAIGGMIFMVGWVCANIGMWRMRATGTGKWGRAVLIIQLVGLVLAVLASFFEATRLLGREGIAFNVIQLAWPLSMLWMLVVGITVIRTKRISDWYGFVPLLCPFWLPIAAISGEYSATRREALSATLQFSGACTSCAATANSPHDLLPSPPSGKERRTGVGLRTP